MKEAVGGRHSSIGIRQKKAQPVNAAVWRSQTPKTESRPPKAEVLNLIFPKKSDLKKHGKPPERRLATGETSSW